MNRILRIGNAQAFWGDRPSAAVEMLSQVPQLDYLTMDYLAEVSMSILAVQYQRDSSRGYPHDFVEVIRALAPYWAAGGRCRLIANAGGLNPTACAQACLAVLERSGCRSMKIGIVSGDDVLSILRADSTNRSAFRNLDTHAPLADVGDRLMTANAYLGASGIVEALQAGADIVVTGRIADPSLVVAPCIHEFGWKKCDWDRLAGATVAGHLLECGTQVTGGISTDWLTVRDPAHIGFPIAEIDSEGECTITKPTTTGGCVTTETVKEQLLYELGDRQRYLCPDVTLSIANLRVVAEGIDRVRVIGAKGCPQPSSLKVSATYRDGYRAAGMLTIVGPDAVHKARRCGDIVRHRLQEAGFDYREFLVECLGSGTSIRFHRNHGATFQDFETVLRIAVESDSEEAVQSFAKELIPLVTAGPQGTTGYAEGRPRVHAVFRYWPCLIEARTVQPVVNIIESRTAFSSSDVGTPLAWPPHAARETTVLAVPSIPATAHAVSGPRSLAQVAYGRSGDKGMAANIGILARSPTIFPWLVEWLTADRVRDYFSTMDVDSVVRYELPQLQGLNFVLRGILRRGLRNDAQGKALAQALLAMPIDASAPDVSHTSTDLRGG